MHFPSLHALTVNPRHSSTSCPRVARGSDHGVDEDVTLFLAVVGALRMQDRCPFCGGEIACSGCGEGKVGRVTGYLPADIVEVLDGAAGAACA